MNKEEFWNWIDKHYPTFVKEFLDVNRELWHTHIRKKYEEKIWRIDNMKRQAMEVSVQNLRDKANELELELLETTPPLGKDVLTQKCQVPIINENDTSDEWRFE